MKTMTESELDTQVLVIHVRGNEERRRYIERQLEPLGLPYTFITDGNMEDLTPEVLDRYFAPGGGEDTMHCVSPRTSCAYKHLLATQYILEHGLEGALVVEDDLRLKPDFKRVFAKSVEEIRAEHSGEPLIANYEESSLMLVPRSQRRKGRVLYRAGRDRFAGCLYVSRKAAEVIMDYVAREKSAFASDTLHQHLVKKRLLTYYWSHPCVACQCSCEGSMPTMIPTRPRPFKRLKWFYKKIYKHLLYFLR